jgi:clan AA aspartic protease (TIGR02281 family)
MGLCICNKKYFLAAALHLSFLMLSISASADTIYLKSGRAAEGIITAETEDSVTIEIGYGNIVYSRSDIDRIEKADDRQVKLLQERWNVQRGQQAQDAGNRQKEAEHSQTQGEVPFSHVNGQILVDVLLNNDVPATLVLDTGASMVVISHHLAEKLGIDVDRLDKKLKMMLADGRESNAWHTILKEINIHGVEAADVDVAVMGRTVSFPPSARDGLLGMAFLNHFSFQIDMERKKLILQRRSAVGR